MRYTVLNVKELFERKKIGVKQGTIEAYRSKLQKMGILGQNESLTEEHVVTFEKIVAEKTEDVSWDKLMMKYIYTDFRQKMKIDFEWSIKSVVKHLKYSIEKENYKVYAMDFRDDSDDFHVLECFIDNFVELGYKYEEFEGSHGTDPNAFNYKIKTPDGSMYYLIGKYNAYTKGEDTHLFFCKTSNFNIMQCNYIGGWDAKCDEEIFPKLEECVRAAQ